MNSSKNVHWNQFAFSKPTIKLAMIVAMISTFGNFQESFAVENTTLADIKTADTSQAAAAPDAPPATPASNIVYECSIVKTEIQTSVEQTENAKAENLSAPVPGNRDDSAPQPTFNALNTINTNVSNASNSATAAPVSDSSEVSADDYSVTRNALTYPLNDPVNGQFTAPLALRESSDATQAAVPVTQSKYQQLPLSFEDARNRLSQLRLMAAGSRPQDALENVNQFVKWLSDIVDAHTKMAAAFSKNETTRTLATSEKQMNTKFTHLRYESQLLKADLLIEEHRNPEALAPLVEIILAMPTSPLGKSAYQRLQELRFSSPDAVTPLATTTSGAETSTAVADFKNKKDGEKTSNVTTDEATKKIAMLPAVQNQKKSNIARKLGNSKKTSKVTTKKSHKP